MTSEKNTAIGRLGTGFTVIDGVISVSTGIIGGATGSTDNAIIRSDGTGGVTIQNSLATIDDGGSINIPTGQSYKVNGTALSASDVGASASGHNHSGTYQPLDSDLTSIAALDSGSNVGKVISAKTGGGYELVSASGGVGGSSGSTDNAIIRADGTGGSTVQTSLVTINDTGTINIPTGQTYNINGVAHTHSEYATVGVGVTNGNSHDHNGGDGGQIAYSSLSGTPTTMTPTAHAASHVPGASDQLVAATMFTDNGKILTLSSPASATVFTNSLTLFGINGSSNSIRLVIPASSIATSGNRIRIQITGSNSASWYDAFSIVERSGSTANGTTTPTPITFDGGAAGKIAYAGEAYWSDWIAFTLDESKDYLIIYDVPASQNMSVRYADSALGGRYTVGSQSCNLQNVSAGSLEAYFSLVTSMNVATVSWTLGSGAASGLGGSSGATDNAILRADGTGGSTAQNSLVTIDDSGSINIPTGQSYKVNNVAIGTGDVVGPASSTDNAVTRFDLATGKLLQNSLVTIDDSGSINIPSGQSYKINNVALAASNVGAAATIHNLVDTTNHPVTGLTTGHVLQALSATTYGFATFTPSLDITGLTAETSIADDDYIPIFDTSASANRKMTKANLVAGLSSGGTSFIVQRTVEAIVTEQSLMYWVAPAACTVNYVKAYLLSAPSASGTYFYLQVMKNSTLETGSIFSGYAPICIDYTTSPVNGVYPSAGTLNGTVTLAAGDVIHFRINQADTGCAGLLVQMKVTFT